MKIKTWSPAMSDAETKELAYWERNVLALHFAEGWYVDETWHDFNGGRIRAARYAGWSRVLSLAGGTITFHIPDDFDVGTLPKIEPDWDGHTTEEKWRRILTARGVEAFDADL